MEEVSLRRFGVGDADELYEWGGDPEVTKFMTWETFTSKEEAREYVAKVILPHPWFKAICLNGKPIGHVVLKQGSGIHSCRAEVGYAIGRRYWKRGLTTTALVAALQMAFKDKELQGMERVDALVLPENVASARVLEKAGFHNEAFLRNYVHLKGTLRDCFLFSYVPTL